MYEYLETREERGGLRREQEKRNIVVTAFCLRRNDRRLLDFSHGLNVMQKIYNVNGGLRPRGLVELVTESGMQNFPRNIMQSVLHALRAKVGLICFLYLDLRNSIETIHRIVLLGDKGGGHEQQGEN